MRLSDTAGLAFWAIASRPLRSVLMALTLGAGAGAVALAAAVLAGYGAQVERMAFGAYARSLVITENWSAPAPNGPPRISDLERLESEFDARLDASAAWRYGRVDAAAGSERAEIFVYGAMGDYHHEADMPLTSGRALTDEETRSAERVCLIGDEAVRLLFPDHRDALGRTVRLNGVACEIVGVFGPARTQTADRYSEAVITPFLAAGRYFQPQSTLAPNEADQLTLVLRDRSMTRQGRIDADRVMRRAHGVPLSQAPPFRYADPAAPARAMERQRDLMSRLLISIAAISMAAAIVGYGAATLASAEMRRRDIALQMACGAYGADILLQFLLESLILGLIGSVFGALLAASVGYAISAIWGLPVAFDPGVAALALAAGSGAGVLAGLLPARRAADAPPGMAVKG